MKTACFIGFFTVMAAASPCHYETWDWNKVQRKTVNHRKVAKTKSELSAEERGKEEGCTVCEEDQVEVKIDNLPAFKICRTL